MRNLSNGSRGADVMFLQCLLNKRGARPRLGEDGIFGPKTQAAVTAFQSGQRVAPANGQVGASTWSKFGAISEKVHAVTPFAQPTNMTCWSAAATIILGNMSVGPGNASTGTGGGMDMGIDNIETFLNGLGWRMINNQSAPPASQLVSALNSKPVWIAFQGAHFAHAVVLYGYYTDGTEEATVFLVQDPWPPNSGSGSQYGTTYHRGQVWLRSVSPPKAAMVQYAAQQS